MKPFVVGLLVFLLWFFAGSWIYTCKIKGLCAVQQTEGDTVPNAPIAKEISRTDTLTVQRVSETTGAYNDNAVKTLYSDEVTPLYNKVLYFDFDSESHKTDEAFKHYITTVIAYLEANPEKKLNITGHTDSVGEKADNEWIGMQRARNAMKYMIKQGIPEERIRVLSRGETEPIASNTTKEGRMQNRRVEITIN